MSLPSLAVVILTYNEEKNLPSCLRSIEGLDCSVTVVDSGSTDRTIEIALAYEAVVLSHAFENYSLQRNWAQSNVPSDAPWILHLDADERLTPALVDEINEVLKNPPESVDGFLLRKRTLFMGRWIRHGGQYPSFHLRLFRKAKGQCEEKRYDQHFITSGPTKQLKNDYIDVIAADLSTWTLRHRRWAELEANETASPYCGCAQVTPRFFGNPIERKRWLRSLYGRAPLFTRAFGFWTYRYFLRLGFLDGEEGLIFHFLQGFWFRFLVDALIVENRRAYSTVELKLAAPISAELPNASAFSAVSVSQELRKAG